MINLTPGKTYHHSEITKAFDGQNEGGMRRSKATNTLHLISDHTKISPYRDEFDGDKVYYCGMGQTGHQDINGTQNKTLNESNTNGVDVYLSEVFKKTYYTFRGKVKLIDVKTKSFRKKDSYKINRCLTKQQKQLGVKLLIVDLKI